MLSVLVVSNFYPPYHLGGYGLTCEDVVEGLKARGHDVRVLTSTYKVRKPQVDGSVYRYLEHSLGWDPTNRYASFFRQLKREWTNQKALTRLIRSYRPDVVYIFNPIHISLAFGDVAKREGVPRSYFVGDDWIARFSKHQCDWSDLWSRNQTLPMRLAKPLLKRLVNAFGLVTSINAGNFCHAQFISEYLKEITIRCNKSATDAKVIHTFGLDVSRFPYTETSGVHGSRLLFVGRISGEKGVHTAIEATRILRKECHLGAVLDIVGGIVDRSYFQELSNMVLEAGLQHCVRFFGPLAHEQLPSVFRDHDILLFPSICEEGLGVTVLEAMSSGLAVVATGTGGSKEILHDGFNCLLFAKADSRTCASQTRRLLDSPALFERIRRAGRLYVEERSRGESTIDVVEQALYEACESRN